MRVVYFAAVVGFALFSGALWAQHADVPRDDGSLAPVVAPVTDTQNADPSAEHVVPPVKDRDAAPEQKISVRGFHVTGVANHPEVGVTPASIQALVDDQYRELASQAGEPVELSFDDMQGVADAIVERYRTAGFIVSNAFLPAQTVGADQIVQIEVLEGRIGKIIVKGTKRYRPGVISAPAEKLRGEPLMKREVDSALLYARDLPGVTVASTFQPGENTGDTDLVMIATEAKRPLKFTLGGNNYGTALTGKYRAQAGVEWASPLGIGDLFNINVDYALDPSDNIYGATSYRLPIVGVRGLSAVVGASRNELQINSGPFKNLNVEGPSSLYYGGMDWKFINRDDLQTVGTFHVIREQSRLDSLGFHLSDEKFTVAEMTYGLLHTDRRFHGMDIFQAGLRKSIRDDSNEPDLVSPQHAKSFLVGKLSYTRMQFLTKSQRLYAKFVGQYTRDALIPMEQFSLGGPDSIRAYPIADALRDSGYYTALEYHVDAPGFADKVSPFYGRPWRELLEFQVFVDYAKGYSAGANRKITPESVSLSGVGAGLTFRLPRFHRFEFHFNAAVPLSSQDASDDKGYHIYSRFSFTF